MYIILVRTTQIFPPSHSITLLQFSSLFAFCLVRDAKTEVRGWVENERMEGKKWENAATQGIYKIMYILMCSACLCLHAFSLTSSMTKEWDVHKGQIGDTFFSGCCCRWNVSIWQGRVMCCLAWKSTTQDDAPLPSIHSQNSFVWEWDEGQGICKVMMICIYALSLFPNDFSSPFNFIFSIHVTNLIFFYFSINI